MVALIKTLQVILSLSLLIIIHEFGHFLWARIFGIRVEKFYLFFDLGGKRLAHWKWGETEFGVGWFPLGGYCKISGMVDESMDLEQLKKDPQPWEFRAHPAWHRLLVLAGGVLNNFIFAILAFAAIAGIWGEAFVSNEGAQIYASELAEEMGFRSGDAILAFDDYVPEDFAMLQADLVRREVSCATVLRDGDTLSLYIDHSLFPKVLNTPYMFDLAIPFVVDSVMAGSPNAGILARGDRIIELDGTPTPFRQDALAVLSGARGMRIEAGVVRGGDTLTTAIQIDTAGMMGIYLEGPRNIVRRHYNVLQAIPAGLRLTGRTISGYLADLKLLVKPSTGAYKSVGSFIAIGQVFPSAWDWYQFLNIVALLSIMLGVMNLIPIPGLDGGHILFTLFEMITGRKPSDRFLAVAQMIGLVLLLLLMFLAFGNDIARLIH